VKKKGKEKRRIRNPEVRIQKPEGRIKHSDK